MTLLFLTLTFIAFSSNQPIEKIEIQAGSYSYWFIPCDSNPAAPLLIWFQGGPGFSMLTSIFLENGPFKLNSTLSLTPTNNPYSWTNIANVLYVDHPLGTGFSNEKKDLPKSEEEATTQFIEFLNKWVKKDYKHLKNRLTYLVGESYGIRFVTAIGVYLTEKCSPLKLAGVSLISGFISPSIQYRSMLKYISSKNLHKISENESFFQKVNKCIDLVDLNNLEKDKVSCLKNIEHVVDQKGNSLNIYNITSPCLGMYCFNSDPLEKFVKKHLKSFIEESTKEWTLLNEKVKLSFEKDMWIDRRDQMEALLKRQVKVQILNGSDDLITNWMGASEVANSLKWQQKKKFSKLTWSEVMLNGKVVGNRRKLDNLEVVVVFAAGHMLLMDQPEVSFELLKEFLRNDIKCRRRMRRNTK